MPRSRGSPVEMTVYPGAQHAFDAPNLPRRELPQYITRAGLVPVIASDPAARQDAFPRVPAFLARISAIEPSAPLALYFRRGKKSGAGAIFLPSRSE